MFCADVSWVMGPSIMLLRPVISAATHSPTRTLYDKQTNEQIISEKKCSFKICKIIIAEGFSQMN